MIGESVPGCSSGLHSSPYSADEIGVIVKLSVLYFSPYIMWHYLPLTTQTIWLSFVILLHFEGGKKNFMQLYRSLHVVLQWDINGWNTF